MTFTKDKHFYKTLAKLCLPIMLQNLITFSVSFADNVMVGALGDTAVSGVFVANQMQLFLQILIGGIEATTMIICSRYFGAKNTDKIKQNAAVGVFLALIIGTFISAVCFLFPSSIIRLFTKSEQVVEVGSEFLSILSMSFVFFCLTQVLISIMRSIEKPKVGFFVSLVSLVINVFFNYALIFGRLGFSRLNVKGSAIATLISRISECTLIIIFVFMVDKKLKLSFKDLFIKAKGEFAKFVKTALPITAGQLIWAVNILAASAIMGRFSAEIIAAVSIANLMSNFIYVAINGLSSGVGVLVSKTIGEGETEKLKDYTKTLQKIFLLLGGLSLVLVLLLKAPILSFYNVSPTAANYAKSFLNVLAITLVGSCYQVPTFFGIIKSGGAVKFAMITDLIFVLLVNLPLAIISLKLWTMPVLTFLFLKSDQILKCVVGAIKIKRLDFVKKV